MLDPVARRRPAPFDLLRHVWFDTYIAEHDAVAVHHVINRDAVDAVLGIKDKSAVHHALLNFVYSNLASEVEVGEIREIFRTMDMDFNGELTRKELQVGLRRKGVKDYME